MLIFSNHYAVFHRRTLRTSVCFGLESQIVFLFAKTNSGSILILFLRDLYISLALFVVTSTCLLAAAAAPERSEVEVEMSVNGRSFTRSNFTVVLFYDCLVPTTPEAASLVALYVLLPLLLGALGHTKSQYVASREKKTDRSNPYFR